MQKKIDWVSSPENAIHVVRNHESLEAKQTALSHLKCHPKHSGAVQILDDINKKPRASYWADFITRKLGKTDFVFVTQEDLIECVKDLGLRTALMEELSNRIKF